MTVIRLQSYRANMARLSYFVLLLFVLINYLRGEDVSQNDNGQYQHDISNILNYMNSQSDAVYYYKSANLLSAHKENDETILHLNVQVDCRPNKEELCIASEISCYSIIQPDLILKSVTCQPEYTTTTVLPNEEIFSIQRRPSHCAGCPVDLNVDIPGLEPFKETALKMIDSESDHRQKIIRVLRIQRQVMATVPAYVRYVLLVETVGTSCEKYTETPVEECHINENTDRICEVEFRDIPSLSKIKHIVGNNCTVIQDFKMETTSEFVSITDNLHGKNNDMDNEIKVHTDYPKPVPNNDKKSPNFDEIAQTGNVEESLKIKIDNARLRDIESQIVQRTDRDPLLTAQKTSDLNAAVKTTTEKNAMFDEFIDIFGFDDAPAFQTTQNRNVKEPVEEVYTKTVHKMKQNVSPKIESVVVDISETKKGQKQIIEKKETIVFETTSSRKDSSEESSEEKSHAKRSKRNVKTSRSRLQLTTDDEKGLIKDLADLAAATVDNMDTDDQKRVVLKVLGSRKFVFDGITYHLTLKVGVSQCSEKTEFNVKGSKNIEQKCKSNLINDLTMICKVQVHVTEEKIFPKVVKSQCQNLKNIKKRNNHNRYKRQRMLMGAPEDLDPNDPYFSELLEGVLFNLDSVSAEEKRLKVIEVIKSSTQVVAGTLVKMTLKLGLTDLNKDRSVTLNTRKNARLLPEPRIKQCDISIWDRPWLPDGREINVKCNDDKAYKFRSKRSLGLKQNLVGAPLDISENDDDFKTFAHDALMKLDSASNENNRLKITRVISASKQVVSGVLFKMQLELGLSEISKSESVTLEDRKNAKLLADPKIKQCSISIWDQPWLPNGREVNVKCDDDKKYKFRSKRSLGQKQNLVGAPLDISEDDDDFKTFAHDALMKLDSASNENNRLKITRVISASKQVVSGVLFKMQLELGLSEISKSESVTLEDRKNAKLLAEPKIKQCSISIWDQPWLPNGREVNVKCDDDKKYKFRSKRSLGQKQKSVKPNIPGAPWDISEDNDDFKSYAHDVLLQLDSETDEENKLKIVNVLNVTKQVVSGVLVKMNLELGLSNIPKNETVSYEERKNAELLEDPKIRTCEITIWDRPWISDGKEVKAKCDDDMKYKFRSKRSDNAGMTGAPSSIDENDKYFQELAHSGLLQLESVSNEDNRLKITNIVSATRQVVAGFLVKMKLELGLSNIPKTNEVSYELRKNSELLSEPKIRACEFSFWDRRPWHPNGCEINVKCDENNKYSFRLKRSVKKPGVEFVSRSKRSIRGNIGMDDHDIHLGLFHDFMREHNKMYKNREEYKKRFKIFKQNMKVVKDLNLFEQGTAKYGATMFADLSRKEFKRYLGLDLSLKRENDLPTPLAEIPKANDLPVEFDWRERGAVTQVKNQGQCGSCWAFSVTGNVEGQYFIKTGKLLEFSEQELVDCDSLDSGCNGGLPDNAYRAIETLGGLETEQDYPYDAEDEKCHFNKTLTRVQLSGAVNITSNETGMAEWLFENGPISIGINANAMQFYRGGVSHPWKRLCSPKSIDHGVLIVGYGVHEYKLFNKTLPYWIVKNSWGNGWGEKGYYRVYRGDGTCGVNTMASSAIIQS